MREGSGHPTYRGHGPQSDIGIPTNQTFAGNSSVLVWDLETGSPNQPWINEESIDLAYQLTFSEGGVASPNLPTLRTLPVSSVSSAPVPEPETYALLFAGLALITPMVLTPAGN